MHVRQELFSKAEAAVRGGDEQFTNIQAHGRVGQPADICDDHPVVFDDICDVRVAPRLSRLVGARDELCPSFMSCGTSRTKIKKPFP